MVREVAYRCQVLLYIEFDAAALRAATPGEGAWGYVGGAGIDTCGTGVGFSSDLACAVVKYEP